MQKSFWNFIKKDRSEKKAIYLDEIWRLIGVTSNKNVAGFLLTDETGRKLSGIYFGEAERFYEEMQGRQSLQIVYYPDINEFRGNRSLQIVVTNYMIPGAQS